MESLVDYFSTLLFSWYAAVANFAQYTLYLEKMYLLASTQI